MSLARRRHDRERVAAKRMKFVLNVWSVYQPGVKYGDIVNGHVQENARWFTPGRFAKIHPARVCSCEWCRGERDWAKKERHKVKLQLRRDPESA